MKKTMLMVLLCVMILTVLCMPAGAVYSADLAEVMTNLVVEEDMAILCNEKLYDEEDARIVQDIDFTRADILVNHNGVLMELGELSIKEAMAASSKQYYVLWERECYGIRIKEKEGAYECSLWIMGQSTDKIYSSKLSQHLQTVADSRSVSLKLCGKQRDVLELYAFSESNMHTLVYVTAEGTFVRFYTGKYAEDGNTMLYVDMPMEEYSAWVAAFRDYTEEYGTAAHTRFGDVKVNTLGELVLRYDTPEDYYHDMERMHIKYDIWVPAVIVVLIAVVIGVVFFIWCRYRNRKKYGY